MEEKTEIHAVDVVRRIRDEQAQLLEGKSPEEIIEFFRRAGESAAAEARSSVAHGREQRFARDAHKTPRP